MSGKRKPPRGTLIFLTCLLAVPTVAGIMYGWPAKLTLETLAPALATGCVLGAGHLLLRPLLRVLFAPIGCLTFGMFGMVIDIGLLYACDNLVESFAIPHFWYAMITAIVVNTLCTVSAGRH